MEEIIEFIRKLKSKELAIIISIISGSFYVYDTIEQRYAKLKETSEQLSFQQSQILVLQKQILALLVSLPKDIQDHVDQANKITETLKIDPNKQIK